MSDNEYERFEVTDYDLENEFNPNRGRRRQTKHQQIYGIWADDSEAEEEEELSTRRRGGKKSKDYSAPIGFVAGGVQQAGKKKKDEERTKEDDESQITDEEDERPSFGRKAAHTSSESDSDIEVRPSLAAPSKAPPQRRPNTMTSSSAKLATWEQHTKGIGAKLLLQMGYEPGKGLGKDLQGIAKPVEAHMRKGRGAIGAYGPETPASIPVQKNKNAIDEGDREPQDQSSQWKKGNKVEKGKKSAYHYRSVQDVIEKGKKSSFLSNFFGNRLNNVPVIDMTGPEKRVLSGYHAIGQAKIQDEEIYEHRQAKKCTNFTLPELMHNLNLIVEMCEQEIISIDKAAHESNDRQRQLEQDKTNIDEIVKLEENHIYTLEKALELVQDLTAPKLPLTLPRAKRIFLELQTDFSAEYKEFGLGDLSAGILVPLISSEFVDWKPLAEPTRHTDLIKEWKGILDMHLSERRNVFDPYSSIIWAGVIPSFRQAAAEWNPKQHQTMAALLDCWAPLFPTWILDNVLEQLILPRLQQTVQVWDPLTDTIPIHVWVLPWSSILGHKMEEFIYPTIREKLGNALQAWVPQDRSARAMITPWKDAFGEGEMTSFLLKHIIPKLQITLGELIINPLQQDLEMWDQVWEWHEIIPTLLMAQLLDKFFFPKWMQTLVIWLNQAPNLDQISRWYTGWKGLLSDDIQQQPAIKEHFRRACELMQRAIGVSSTTAPTPTTTHTVTQTAVESSIKPPALMDLQIEPPVQLEFKELVSQRCAERGILFAPMPGRREFGKQVYRIGKLYCYIDRSVLMVSDGNFAKWTPTSLGLMIERAATG